MYFHQEAHPETLRYAFENKKIAIESGDEVISYLNSIQSATLPQYVDSDITLSSNFDLAEFEDCSQRTKLTRS